MPDSQSAGQIIFFDLILAGFLFFYATTSSTISNELQLAVTTLTKPWTLLPPPSITCAPLDVFCSATKDITTATAYIGWAILNLPILLFQVLEKIGAGLTLIYRLFLLTGNDFGIPFLGFILLGFQISLAFYGFSLLRGREP